MSQSRSYFVYIVSIVSSRSRIVYTGVTNNLGRRILEHRTKLIPGFTKKYRIHRLMYYEAFGDIRDAIAREKQIKAWTRAKRVALIEAKNPTWADLSESLFARIEKQIPRSEPRTSG